MAQDVQFKKKPEIDLLHQSCSTNIAFTKNQLFNQTNLLSAHTYMCSGYEHRFSTQKGTTSQTSFKKPHLRTASKNNSRRWYVHNSIFTESCSLKSNLKFIFQTKSFFDTVKLTKQKCYFVTKIVLTNCEKKLFQ